MATGIEAWVQDVEACERELAAFRNSGASDPRVESLLVADLAHVRNELSRAIAAERNRRPLQLSDEHADARRWN